MVINGVGMQALFSGVNGLCLSQGGIFVADANNQRIRRITFDSAAQPVSGASLALQTYPGLKITGIVGRSYRVEASTDAENWATETTILLTKTPYLWIDENAVTEKKFYRAFLLP